MTTASHKIRVLFVDDEPTLLDGYRKAATVICPDWELHFAPSGESALTLLKAIPLDVVIADIAMNGGMAGTALQHEIMDDYPHIIRVILSGMIDGTSIVDSAKYSEVRLCKPSSMKVIREKVEKALSLRPRG
jgi:DNA-binding NtrC family response regulator